jgi:hypothetical protein
MKAGIAALLAFLVVASALAAGTAAAREDRPRDLAPVVETGATDHFGGGEWVSVKAGDTRFAVTYGTDETPNTVTIFAVYKRFLGGAEIYDEQDNFLRQRGIPVWTMFAQSFDRFTEFELVEVDGHRRLMPVKTLDLRNVSWSLAGLQQDVTDEAAFVNFTLTATDLPYTAVFDGEMGTMRAATAEDGVLDEFTLTFRLEVRIVVLEDVPVPWYRVTVANGNEDVPTASEFLEYRNHTGPAVVMGAKYDHYILGWDFASDRSELGLVTHMRVGTFIPRPVAQWIHLQFQGEEARSDGFHADNRTSEPEEPLLLTKDRIEFVDNWYRVGRATWVSDVVVDGEDRRMAFRVVGVRPVEMNHGLELFRGFGIVGVFVYPQGNEIYHDPGFEAAAFLPAMVDVVNLAPLGVLVLQALVVGIAVGPALWLRSRRKRQG